MLQSRLLEKVIGFLSQNRIEYMVTGSVVSSLQGEPRSTHDIDLVVLLKSTDVKKLADGFPSPDFYLNINSIEEAIRLVVM